MTDYLANSQDAYSRDVIDSLPHSPWAEPTPVCKSLSEVQREARNLRRRTKEQAEAMRKKAERVNLPLELCDGWVSKSLTAPR